MSDRRFLLHYLPFLLVRADTLLSRALMDDIEQHGHSVPEWRVLATLHDGDALSVGEIAELTILPQPTVSRWVDRLEQRGLVTRHESAADRRRTVVHITAAGERAAGQLVTLARERYAETTADLPAEELRALELGLLRLIEQLEPAREP